MLFRLEVRLQFGAELKQPYIAQDFYGWGFPKIFESYIHFDFLFRNWTMLVERRKVFIDHQIRSLIYLKSLLRGFEGSSGSVKLSDSENDRPFGLLSLLLHYPRLLSVDLDLRPSSQGNSSSEKNFYSLFGEKRFAPFPKKAQEPNWERRLHIGFGVFLFVCTILLFYFAIWVMQVIDRQWGGIPMLFFLVVFFIGVFRLFSLSFSFIVSN